MRILKPTEVKIVRIGAGIYSPLGTSLADNFAAVRAGRTGLALHEQPFGLAEPITASLFEPGAVEEAFEQGKLFPPRRSALSREVYTRFEQMAILSAGMALKGCKFKPSSERVLFMVSTTKGNVDLLDDPQRIYIADRLMLSVSAVKIATYFGNRNLPIVVSNACTSGVSAQIAAWRMLMGGRYDRVVVIGADCQSKFIVSGFQSFKALSATECKPYDRDRNGLNLGEAAATVIYERRPTAGVEADDWVLTRGAIRNDANHISGPSRTGEGSYRALKAVLGEATEGVAARLAFINAHGTATAYNDEMEAIAIDRAGLADVPVCSLKGYFGHTMGAAGVLESLLSMEAADHGIVPGTRGYETCGVSRPLRLSAQCQTTQGRQLVKLMSGFGGCNAAILLQKGDQIL